MTSEELSNHVDRRIALIKSVLAVKRGEYSTSDELHNFREAAKLSRCSEERALLGMMNKHLVSVIDIIHGRPFTEAQLEEKIGDAINYLILLEAMIKERRSTSNFVPEDQTCLETSVSGIFRKTSSKTTS